MDRLSNDHRTATLAGDRGARRQLEKVADRLFADLRSHERAEWVAISTGMAPALVVATDSRLLTISMIGRSTQAIERPFTIVLGKKRLIGQSVDVIDARGLCLSLLLQEPDLRALQMTGGASSRPGSTTQAPPPQPSASAHPAATAPPPGSTGAWRWGGQSRAGKKPNFLQRRTWRISGSAELWSHQAEQTQDSTWLLTTLQRR